LGLVFGLLVGLSDGHAETKIAIYFNPLPDKDLAIIGYEGAKLALEEAGYEDQVQYVKSLDPETLRGVRVLVLSCVYGFPKQWKEDDIRSSLRNFVEGGGGIILLNESMGWRRALSSSPPFPEIGRGTGEGDKYKDSTTSGVGPATTRQVGLEVTEKDHPVTKGIEPFKALFDMPDIAVGKDGKAVMKKTEGNAAGVVVGTFGKGRVVLIAPTLGAGPRNLEQSPTGPALKLLLNAVEWAAAGSQP
jgi:hypothetical protein